MNPPLPSPPPHLNPPPVTPLSSFAIQSLKSLCSEFISKFENKDEMINLLPYPLKEHFQMILNCSGRYKLKQFSEKRICKSTGLPVQMAFPKGILPEEMIIKRINNTWTFNYLDKEEKTHLWMKFETGRAQNAKMGIVHLIDGPELKIIHTYEGETCEICYSFKDDSFKWKVMWNEINVLEMEEGIYEKKA